MQKASLKDKAVSFGVLFDEEKIKTGKLSGGGKLVIAITNFANGQVTRITDVTDSIPVKAIEGPSEESNSQSG